MRSLTCLFIVLMWLVVMPAQAQGYYSAQDVQEMQEQKDVDENKMDPEITMGHSSVTSVNKCLDEIGPEAAAVIRTHSLTPYSDCQKKLRALQKEKAKAAKEEPEEAETPRNFARVADPDAKTVPARDKTPDDKKKSSKNR